MTDLQTSMVHIPHKNKKIGCSITGAAVIGMFPSAAAAFLTICMPGIQPSGFMLLHTCTSLSAAASTSGLVLACLSCLPCASRLGFDSPMDAIADSREGEAARSGTSSIALSGAPASLKAAVASSSLPCHSQSMHQERASHRRYWMFFLSYIIFL